MKFPFFNKKSSRCSAKGIIRDAHKEMSFGAGVGALTGAILGGGVGAGPGAVGGAITGAAYSVKSSVSQCRK